MKNHPPRSAWDSARGHFIEAGGNTTQSFGFGRIMGQVYALLYLSSKPMSLDDIAKFLVAHDLPNSPITTSDGRLVGLLRREDVANSTTR